MAIWEDLKTTENPETSAKENFLEPTSKTKPQISNSEIRFSEDVFCKSRFFAKLQRILGLKLGMGRKYFAEIFCCGYTKDWFLNAL